MDFELRKAVLRDVPTPPADAGVPVPLEDRTMDLRLQRVLKRMRKRGLDALAVYCDLEHGGNFEYLTGFVTRFEEALLVLKADGKAALMVGNENLKLAGRCCATPGWSGACAWDSWDGSCCGRAFGIPGAGSTCPHIWRKPSGRPREKRAWRTRRT